MCNINYICKYEDETVFEKNELEKLSENDIYYIKNELYKMDILNIFELQEFDNNIINEKLENIYNKIKNHNELNKIISKLSAYYFSEDKLLGLMILFSYDFLYLFYPCLTEYLKNTVISDNNLKKLEKAIH